MFFNSFGRKKRFIQEANRRSVLKGTVGLFGNWCKSQGLAKDGKVTLRCINKAKRSGNTTLIKRATFAKNIGGYNGAKKRRTRFGKNSLNSIGKKTIKKSVKKTVKKSVKIKYQVTGRRKKNESEGVSSIKYHNELYGKYNKYGKKVIKTKYTSVGGRKSPGVSATKFSVGTVKKGLDGNKWVIVKIKSGVQRWKKMSVFEKKSRFGKSRFGKSRFGAYEDDYINDLIDNDKISNLIEDEIKIAEKIIDNYPKNDNLKKRAVRLLFKIKKGFIDFEYRENIESLLSVIQILTSILTVFYGMSEAYSTIHQASGVFRYIAGPLNKLINRFSKKQIKISNEMVTQTDEPDEPFDENDLR